MERTYPQETMGITLYIECTNTDLRRIYLKRRASYVEVGEFSKGVVAQEVFGVPAHVHCVQLRCATTEGLCKDYFANGGTDLAGLMDVLDERGIDYGYLNNVGNSYVSYRPAASVMAS